VSLIGFAILLVFVYGILIRSGIIALVTRRTGDRNGEPVALALLYVFGLAVLFIGLGIVLQYYKTHILVDVDAIVEKLVEKSDPATRADMPGLKQLIREQLAEAVEALATIRGQKDAPPGINQAFGLLKQGNPKAAEKIFQEIEEKKTAQGKTANKQAAAAARHIGALAYLHDTRKALNAYRRATRLDPSNMEGWNMLGALLMRTGALSDAEAAFRKVESLAKNTKNEFWRAAAYGNLGIIYQIRGDLERAEAMHQKSLEIHKALGHKKGVAKVYGNLGIIYRTRGNLDQAEAMYQKALEVDKALGRKEGMAVDYRNLGSIYETRGHLDRTKIMYRKALALFKAIGAQPQVARTRAYLRDLSRD
jgi:tetratricopeptide (TPR) repeat protein